MQEIIVNKSWELQYNDVTNTYFLYDMRSDDVLTIVTPEDFIEVADMLQAHMDGNLIE